MVKNKETQIELENEDDIEPEDSEYECESKTDWTTFWLGVVTGLVLGIAGTWVVMSLL